MAAVFHKYLNLNRGLRVEIVMFSTEFSIHSSRSQGDKVSLCHVSHQEILLGISQKTYKLRSQLEVKSHLQCLLVCL